MLINSAAVSLVENSDMTDRAWQTTTHRWATPLDLGHITTIRQHSARFAPSGVLHLVLEVLAYAAEEAQATGGGNCGVGLRNDGAVLIVDDGRGTDTRASNGGQAVRKPIMSTKDVRFFDSPSAPLLPDGYPRRGMSVVAALSQWLVHTNRRETGAWTQRYEWGAPTTGLIAVPGNGTTGTTVEFLADPALPTLTSSPVKLKELASRWSALVCSITCLGAV